MPESGPVHADRQQLQARAPEAAASPEAEYLPPGAMGILELQRTAGNRAVTAAISSGARWSMPADRPMPMLQLMPAVQRWAGNRAATALRARTLQRAPGDAPTGTPDDGGMGQTIKDGIHRTVQAAHAKMQHVPPQTADMWIGILAAYTKKYPDPTLLRLVIPPDPEDLTELLRPWGYVGRVIKAGLGGLTGNLADDQPIDSLLQSIAAWQAEDAGARKKRRARTKGSFGYYHREVTKAERARDDEMILAGPSRDTPADDWKPTTEGTRANRRSQREDMRNQHALDQAAAIRNQGPGGFAGMVVGGIVGSMPGMDFHKSTEFMMQLGSMADALILTKVNAAEMKGISGGAADRYQDQAYTAKAPERAPMPSPSRPGRDGGGRGGGGGGGGGGAGPTRLGMGALGPAGEGAKPTQLGIGAVGPAGLGARPRAGVGYLEEATPGQVITAFKRNPNYVRKSTSDKWHSHIWREELKESGKWNPADGPSPPAPMAFHLKNGMLQVNEIAWKESRGTLDEILRPHERIGGRGGGGGRGGRPAKDERTQGGYAPGPGAAPAPARSGKTEVGVPAAPGGVKPTFKVPDGPPPVPPGNTVRPASQTEVKELFARDPYSVIVSDGLEMHQYIWEYKNWRDGKRVTSNAPAAFWLPHGQVRVHSELWQKDGGNVFEILAPQSSGRQATEFEAASTLPGGAGGGAGSTNVSIAPGLDRKK